MPAPLPDSVPPSPLSPLTSLSSSPIVPPTMPNVVANPGTPQTPNTPKYDPVFRPWKQKLQFATFIGSFVGKDQPLKPVPYPEMPSGERVAVSGLEDYYKKRCWEMPMCFCGLMDGMDHPALFYVPRSLRSPNYGRPIIMCSIMKCSYWVDLQDFITANPDVPRRIYPLRDALRLTASQLMGSPDQDGKHPSPFETPTRKSVTPKVQTTPTMASSQLPQVEAETLPPSQARPSSPSAIRRTDTELLDYGAPRIPDIFGTNFQFQQELEAAMAPLGVEGSRALLLTMFDPNCPGISMSKFIRIVKQCPLCKLLTSSSLMHMHRCPSPSGSGEQLNARQYEASGTIRKRRKIGGPASSAIAMAQRNSAGGSGTKPTRNPVAFFSPEPKPVIEPSLEPVVVIEISSDDD
ncbi:hypothetical protein BGW80DRAFT_1567728 [Lactifluus volemus]|nr:hypothetical protein BGW80DRAFT_1567728 [Lactifluus volemus]